MTNQIMPIQMLEHLGFRIMLNPQDTRGDCLLQIACTWRPAGKSELKITANVELPRDMLEDMDSDPERFMFYMPTLIGMVERDTGVHYDDDTVKALANFIGMTIRHEINRRAALPVRNA